MKVYENIEKAKNFKLELKKVIDDLIPLRSSRKATEAYYDKHLENDWAYSKWLDDKQDWELHVHSNKKFPDFKLPKSAISPESARAFRKALLEVISDDKYSFGYLYFLLASEENREASMVLYPCVPDEIDYAIQFDIDEIGKEIDAIDDLDKKIIRLIQWKTDSDNRTEYEGELKIRFNKWIVNRINDIKLEKENIRELPKPVKESTEETMLLPEELNTERARKYFTKAIECKYMEKTENGYRWLYDNGSKVSLAYFCNDVFCPNNIEKLPETSLNKLFNITRLGSALYQIYNAKKPPKWKRGLEEFFAE